VNDVQLARQLAAEFGATPERLNRIRRTQYPQSAKDLAELQREAQAAYKKLAFKYHPDRNPDDLEAATEKFKLLPIVLTELENLRVAPQQRQRVARRMVFVPGFGIGVATSSATGPRFDGFGQVIMDMTNAGGPSTRVAYDARRVTFVRVK